MAYSREREWLNVARTFATGPSSDPISATNEPDDLEQVS